MSRLETVKDTLVRFGFGKRDAKALATEIIRNLDNYANIQDLMRTRFGKAK